MSCRYPLEARAGGIAPRRTGGVPVEKSGRNIDTRFAAGKRSRDMGLFSVATFLQRLLAPFLLVSLGLGVGSERFVARPLREDVVGALVAEADRHDLTVPGATREGLLQQLVFGSIPEGVASRVRGTVIMAKRHMGITSWVTRWMARR